LRDDHFCGRIASLKEVRQMIIKTGILLYIVIYLLLFFKKLKGQIPLKILIDTVFFIYICIVAEVAFFPIHIPAIGSFSKRFSDYSYGNILPFKDLILALTSSTRSLHSAVKEIILNIFMLMPFGFLYPIVLRKDKFKNVLLSTFVLSFIIELVQLLMTVFWSDIRSFDTTDLITNIIGGCIGFVIYKMTLDIESDRWQLS
jgi:glycopeptide antibiotics resistance protein